MSNNVIAEFGRRISYIRNKKDISQYELAKAIGRSQSMIAILESGKMKKLPNDETLSKLSIALGTGIESLLGGNEFILDRFDAPVKDWIMSEASIPYIKNAFLDWAHDNAK